VVFIGGVLGAAFAPVLSVLMLMRVVIGLAVGAGSVGVPLYIGELAPARYRGALVSFNQFAITSGVLLAFLVDFGLSDSQNWRLMFGLAAIPAAVLLIGTITQPETPHWLITHGRAEQGREVLRRIRRPGEDIEGEAREIARLRVDHAPYRELWSPGLRRTVALGVTLAVLQQVTGINTIIYYGPTILHDAGLGNSAALLASVIHGVVSLAMVVVTIRLVDRIGRRPLFLAGTTGMTVSLLVLATVFAVGGGHLHGAATVVAVAAQALYTGAFALGFGAIFWIVISELYPIRVRGAAMSAATLANWVANFIVSLTFLSVLHAISVAGTLYVFAAFSFVSIVFGLRAMPEYKQRSLQQIEQMSVPSVPQ
jgi:sugar porter (SP) family MFS transporter